MFAVTDLEIVALPSRMIDAMAGELTLNVVSPWLPGVRGADE